MLKSGGENLCHLSGFFIFTQAAMCWCFRVTTRLVISRTAIDSPYAALSASAYKTAAPPLVFNRPRTALGLVARNSFLYLLHLINCKGITGPESLHRIPSL
jgi:hypothetical protein